MSKYQIMSENPYFEIGSEFSANWDCTVFYVDKIPMTQEQRNYFELNANKVKRL